MWNHAAGIFEKTSGKRIIRKPPHLDSCLDRSYVLRRSEKYDAFLAELGVNKFIRAKAIAFKPTITLTKENGEYALTIAYSEDQVEKIYFKIGKKVQGLDIANIVTEVKGNKIIQTQKLRSKKIIITREFRKNDLTVTMEANLVKCVRYYVVAKSNHSITTETSRRDSFFETITKPEDEKSTHEVEGPGLRSSTSENDVEDICY